MGPEGAEQEFLGPVAPRPLGRRLTEFPGEFDSEVPAEVGVGHQGRDVCARNLEGRDRALGEDGRAARLVVDEGHLADQANGRARRDPGAVLLDRDVAAEQNDQAIGLGARGQDDVSVTVVAPAGLRVEDRRDIGEDIQGIQGRHPGGSNRVRQSGVLPARLGEGLERASATFDHTPATLALSAFPLSSLQKQSSIEQNRLCYDSSVLAPSFMPSVCAADVDG